MDISNLKEEELHLRAKKSLASLRKHYVNHHRELGLRMLLVNQQRRVAEVREPTVVDWHFIRAHQIALAECELSKMIKGEESAWI